METATATTPATSFFQDINRPSVTKDDRSLNPRLTRYGLTAIWPITDLPSTAFMRWELAGNKFHPFVVFKYPVPTETTSSKGPGEMFDRLPADQIKDLVRRNRYFVDFTDIAELDNEESAKAIFTLLSNPNKCSKYPYELENSCTTCWLDYLRSGEAEAKAIGTLGESLYPVFRESQRKLTELLARALTEANRQVDEASSQVNDPKVGKSTYEEVDYLNIRHTHNAMPEYKTANPTAAIGSAVGKELAEAIKSVQTGPSPEVMEMLRKQQEQIEALTAKLQEKPTAEAVDASSISINDMVETPEGPGVVVAKPFGKIQVDLGAGKKQMFTKGDVTKVEDNG